MHLKMAMSDLKIYSYNIQFVINFKGYSSVQVLKSTVLKLLEKRNMVDINRFLAVMLYVGFNLLVL